MCSVRAARIRPGPIDHPDAVWSRPGSTVRGCEQGDRVAARIGVVGAGWWATRAHLPAIVANPEAELVAIADPIDDKRDRAVAAFGPERAYRSHTEMLDGESLDGVVIAVPHMPTTRWRSTLWRPEPT